MPGSRRSSAVGPLRNHYVGRTFIAGNLAEEETRKLLGADSLEYLGIQALLSTAPGGADNYCAACFDGKYPEQVPEGSTKFRCE